ncbi:unnamed protein product [Pseudo-nitzschia multistriata]|uniref:EamA domain-containing protein n=1 Tax=Pseudo-nitzschia multistriata TaxID=183589 RepID=A0A448YWE2_9STRA|nr:unnamed protein product [Pseudo-nitzschia multistriata]
MGGGPLGLTMTKGRAGTQNCGLWEICIFVMAILSGTASSVLSKLMMGLQGVGLSGEPEVFRKPIFQTFATFLGMSMGLVLHIVVLKFRLPFPGYEEYFSRKENRRIANHDEESDGEEEPGNATNECKLGSGSFSIAATSMIRAKYFGSGQFITATKGTKDYTNTDYGTLLTPVYKKNFDENHIHTTLESFEPRGNCQLPTPFSTNDDQNLSKKDSNQNIPLCMYLFLAAPSVFCLVATALSMIGLQYVDVSVYQMLRCSGIVFVAWMKQHFLGDRLHHFQWIGVLWNVVGVVLVGTTALLDKNASKSMESSLGSGVTALTEEEGEQDGDQKTLYGVGLILSGAIVQAMQFVFEEKVMKMEMSTPPLLLIGTEGLWGCLLCLLVVYPLAYAIPGDDYVCSTNSNVGSCYNDDNTSGSYENPANTYAIFKSSSHIQIAFTMYLIAIFGFNFFAIMVTYMLDSVWHAILDNFRPISVWFVELLIYYVFSSTTNASRSPTPQLSFGEDWTPWSWIQVCALVVLLYGTAIYNAPNAGPIKLKGNWYSLGFDFTDEYREIEEHRTRVLSSLVRTTKFEFVPTILADQETLNGRYQNDGDEDDSLDIHRQNDDENLNQQTHIDDSLRSRHRHQKTASRISFNF